MIGESMGAIAIETKSLGQHNSQPTEMSDSSLKIKPYVLDITGVKYKYKS